MNNHFHLPDILGFLAGLVPGAVGATIAVALDRTMTWLQRFVAIAVGIVVSHYARGVLDVFVDWSPIVFDAVAFSAGMVAYKAVPKFIESASDVIASVPGRLRDRFLKDE